MNILIPYSWLKDYLKTNTDHKKLASALTLSGPTVDRTEKAGNDYVYDIEVTTNRVDAMSVYGIAREANAILSYNNKDSKLNKPKTSRFNSSKELDIKIKNNPNLCKRILAVKLSGLSVGESPKKIKDRLQKVGQRPLNNLIDITNYVMWEIGHPIHVFDYDRLKEKKIIVREAEKGEKLTTLDNKTLTLNGGEVVFDNGKGEIIDLPGIMGTKNTVVTKDTKNILLWIESVNAAKIRKASLELNLRTQAAILNEKHVDAELGKTAIKRASYLYEKHCGAKVTSKLVDIYPEPYREKSIKLDIEFIEDRLGIELKKNEVSDILRNLSFNPKWKGNTLTANIPSFRSHDIEIPEDIVEEVARIYGYQNLPSNMLSGVIPEKPTDSPFGFERKLKGILKGAGGVEVYTLSLVPKKSVEKNALKLKNPLGEDSKYLRMCLRPSLVDAANVNNGEKDPFHLFELANIYKPRQKKLPDENMRLAGVFAKYDYRKAKGVIETLLEELNINYLQKQKDKQGFKDSSRIELLVDKETLGEFGILKSGYIYYELDAQKLHQSHKPTKKFKPVSKYPPQIEDLTLQLPPETKVANIITTARSIKYVTKFELIDIFKDSYTFRVHYHSPENTLTDEEVRKIRKKLVNRVAKNFGAKVS